MKRDIRPDEFIVAWKQDAFFFFEQDDATRYLYIGNQNGILHDLHIYNRQPAFTVHERELK